MLNVTPAIHTRGEINILLTAHIHKHRNPSTYTSSVGKIRKITMAALFTREELLIIAYLRRGHVIIYKLFRRSSHIQSGVVIHNGIIKQASKYKGLFEYRNFRSGISEK